MTDVHDIQDFTQPRGDVLRFRIDDDVFEAVPAIGAELLRHVCGMTDAAALAALDATGADEESLKIATRAAVSQTTRTMAFLDEVLLPDSAQRFGARLRSTTEPISIEQAFQVWQWLISQYGSRPTKPSSPSQNGHGGTGTTSTAGAPVGT